MTTVKIIHSWGVDHDLMRQTPSRSGRWKEITFTTDPQHPSDYVVILNGVPARHRVTCSPNNIWAIIQEPPADRYAVLHYGPRCAGRVYTSDPSRQGRRYIHSHPSLPWLVNKSYDELADDRVPDKTCLLSCITSNCDLHAGHRHRLAILERLKRHLQFDLYGRGFNPIADKWEAHAPYYFSIVIENFSNPYYWSEKFMDALLAWTVPIYYGCTNISSFFPTGSYIPLDIERPDALDTLRNELTPANWQRRLPALREARRRCLDEHQLFPFIAERVHADLRSTSARVPEAVVLSNKRPLSSIADLPRSLVAQWRDGRRRGLSEADQP